MRRCYYQILFLPVLLLFALAGCDEIDDREKLGEAQSCLDGVTSSTYQKADECIDPIMGLNSPEANVVKCSGLLLGGGLTTQKVKNAALKLKEENASKNELLFISYLAISDQSRANSAATTCKSSKNRSLIYISSLVQLGTLLVLNLPGGFTETPSLADLENLLNSGALDNDNATIGEIATNVVTNYCTDATKDQDVCKEFSAAVNAGSSNEEIGQLVRDRLNTNN